MFAYLLRRLLALPLVLFGVTVLLEGLVQLLPPAARAVAFIHNTRQLAQINQVIQHYGLDKPFPVQYWNWLKAVVHGNLGWSTSVGMPVSQAIATYFPATAELAVDSFILIMGFGIWLGVLGATHRDRFVDHATRILSILGWSLPTFLLAIWLLQMFYGYFDWFPPGRLGLSSQLLVASASFHHYTGFNTIDALLNGRWGVFVDAVRHLVLPVATLTVVSTAQLMRVMRAELLDTFGMDYVRTARAKGVAERTVVYKHALRNALIPVLTLAGPILFYLLGGVVITETVFNYPGLGNWAAQAALSLDMPAVLGYALLTSVIVVLANLAVDITYAVVDPRIQYG